MSMTWLRTLQFVLWSLIVVTGIGAALLSMGAVPPQMPHEKSSGVPEIGGQFKLTTHRGATLTEADLRGRPFLVFFGFTYCPDIFPTTLSAFTARFETLGRR
jgi:protein SCO1